MSNERRNSQDSHNKNDAEDEPSVYVCAECNKCGRQIQEPDSVYLMADDEDDSKAGGRRRRRRYSSAKMKKRSGEHSRESMKYRRAKLKSNVSKHHSKSSKKHGKKSSSSQERHHRRHHRKKSQEGSKESKVQGSSISSVEDPEASIHEKRSYDVERARRTYKAKLKEEPYLLEELKGEQDASFNRIRIFAKKETE
ncbi:hypothetical protein OESDEN_07430 [Oesophagostomum dentatum]|uniref:Uncharacterized protein n=1 Tax=Oesophagostomum dentatum TaxID=61180 RepID=A0A0B1T982_OESDE|nr:hypothetical protein OESDEN_07430 [Oesophagostomum dentatum]